MTTKWEYIHSVKGDPNLLTKMGEQGYEAWFMDKNEIWFKRPLKETTEPRPDTPVLNSLRSTAEKFVNLLSDPQPGLMTWREAVSRLSDEIHAYTNAKEKLIYAFDRDRLCIMPKEYWELYHRVRDESCTLPFDGEACGLDEMQESFYSYDDMGKRKVVEAVLFSHNIEYSVELSRFLADCRPSEE